MTFPAGIVRVFSGTPPPPVLSFRLVHTAPIEHFQPNADLLFRYCWEEGGRNRGSRRLVGARQQAVNPSSASQNLPCIPEQVPPSLWTSLSCPPLIPPLLTSHPHSHPHKCTLLGQSDLGNQHL